MPASHCDGVVFLAIGLGQGKQKLGSYEESNKQWDWEETRTQVHESEGSPFC